MKYYIGIITELINRFQVDYKLVVASENEYDALMMMDEYASTCRGEDGEKEEIAGTNYHSFENGGIMVWANSDIKEITKNEFEALHRFL